MPSKIQCPLCGKFYNPKFRTDQCPHEAPNASVVRALGQRSIGPVTGSIKLLDNIDFDAD